LAADHGRPRERRLQRPARARLTAENETVNVRDIVDDAEAAIAFYRDDLGFELVMHPAPTFAILARGPLRLLLSVPSDRGGGGQAMPDGRRPEPGGGNRISLQTDDLAGAVDRLRAAAVRFRGEIVHGVATRS
jgi:catechol 2,3-dioxygenase-like lactoylglutathione lyase family enzyme